MISEWVGKFIGIPYLSQGQTKQGADCLGLMELVFKERFDIILPNYNHVDANDLPNVAKHMTDEESSGRWIKIKRPEKYCIVLLKIAGFPVHVGLVVDDHRMLHSLKGHESVIERFDGTKWSKRIEGFYRYVM